MSFQRMCSILVAGVMASASAAAAPVIFLGPEATTLVHDAATELQRYLYGVNGELIALESVEEVTAGATGIVLGTASSLPDVGEAWPFGLTPPRDDGYILHTVNGRLIVIAGATPAGTQNGAYGLLEGLGFGFYLGGDTYPDSIPKFTEGDVPQLHESESPAFAIRGSLPWYNFFNSPTTWELADHRAFIDQLVRMRCNFLGFHAYDSEPFAAYEWEGRLVGGEPLRNTSTSTWGTHPMATDEFLAGTGQYFARDYFGAASSFIEDRDVSIRTAKDVLREALNYAKRRGMKVCLGFELYGNPMAFDVQARFETQLRALLEDYPTLDYVWLWQPEGRGILPQEWTKPRSLWESYTQRWSDTLADIEEPERRAEAVRLALFALHANQVLHAVRPGVQLVVSGWGGDAWLKCTDMFPGLDRILPEDIAFAALDNIVVSPTVSEAYGHLAPDRVRWPIVWFEYDGDQWFPQPNLRATAGACRDALAKGCQGLLGIHWRTRAVEEEAAYCAQFAWDTGLTVEAFCRRRAESLFGEKAGEAMAGYLLRLQDLGYRWVGGKGQSECGQFSWSEGEESKRVELATIAQELRAELTQLAPLQHPRFRTDRKVPLEDLVRQIDYVVAFDRAASEFLPDSGFDELVYGGDIEGAADLVRDSGLAGALHTYARRIKNKGELGVLATINAKAWTELRTRAGFDEEMLAALDALPGDYDNEPQVLVLPDRVIAVGVSEEGLRAVRKTRPLGGQRFTVEELEPMGRTSFALALPQARTQAQNFEYGIEVKSGTHTVLAWPEHFPDQLHTMTTLAPEAPVPPRVPRAQPAQAVSAQHTVVPDRYSVQLTWSARDGEAYTVSREGKRLGTVCDGWFEDTVPRSGTNVNYSIVSRNLFSGETATANLIVPVPELPLPAPPEHIRIVTRANRIVLGWDSDNPAAAQYYILKYDTEHRVIEETYIDADYGHYLQMSDQVTGGVPYTYTVASVAPDGRIGPPSKPVGIISSNEPLEPSVYLSFEDDAHLAGLAQVANNALALGGRGWAELPAQPEWDPDHALTLAVWVKLDDLEGMPVLICKGAWQHSGYFLQIFDKQIRFYLAGVDTLDAGHPKAGTWQHIVATFGFNQMRLYLNGEQVGRKRVIGRPRPSPKPLLVGRYEASDDVYFVRGLMDDISIYMVPLTPGEVRALYNETRR